MLHYEGTDLSKGTDSAKSRNSKSIWFVTTGFLIMGLNFKILSVMLVRI